MEIRDTTPEDAGPMADLLNAIIAIGGTTAHQVPKTAEAVRTAYIDGPAVRISVLAWDQGQVIGWQAVDQWQSEMHIGSFVRPGGQARGVGVAMFARTLAQAKAQGIPALVASIRADNLAGLRYYAKLGFADFAHEPDFVLETGARVGRVHRRLTVV